MILEPDRQRPTISGLLTRALAIGIAVVALLTPMQPAAAAETVVIGAEDDWFPFSGVVDGKVKGLGVDIVRASFDAVGVKVDLHVVPYSRCLELTRRGELIACFDTVRNSVTEPDYLWPNRPLFRPFIGIYARKGSGQHNLEVSDLEERLVAVTRSYEYGEAFDTNHAIRRVVTDRDANGFRMLAAGRADYMVAYVKVADQVLKRSAADSESQIEQVGIAAQVDIHLAFSRSHPRRRQVLDLFNEGFSRIVSNGTYRKIERQWR